MSYFLTLLFLGQLHRTIEKGARRANSALSGSLELEAIAAVHELASDVRISVFFGKKKVQVKQISVSEILPRTSDLIFLNIKTYEGFVL